MTEEERAAAMATAIMAAPFGVGLGAAADANTAAATGRAADTANAAQASETPTWTANGGAYSQSSAGAGTPVTTVRAGPGYSAADVVPGRAVGETANAGPNRALLGETGNTVHDLLYGAKVGEGLPGSAGVSISARPTPVELENLTQKHGVEFAVTYKYGPGPNGAGGQYYLYSGTNGAVEVPLAADQMLIYHTHPGGPPFASRADMDLLDFLKAIGSPQRSSQIVPVGKPVVRFGPNGWGY